MPKVIDLLFILSVLELVLGVGGHLFEITEIVSIRMFIFTLILLLGVGHVAVKGYLRLGKLSSLFALVGALTFLHGSVVGLMHGNQVKHIIGDANAFLFPLYGIVAFHFAKEHHWTLQTIINLVLATVTLLAATVDLAFLGFRFGYLDSSYAIHLTKALNSTFRFELAISDTRIYFINELFILATILIVLALSVMTPSTGLSVGMSLIFCTHLLALVASRSRGMHLGFLAGFLLTGLLMSWMPTKKRLYSRLAALLILSAMIVGFTYHESQLRILRSFDLSEPSNKDRFGDAPVLWEKFKEHPVEGNGFGTTIEGVVKSTENPYSFELIPLEFPMKLGILGSLIWFTFFACMGLEMKRAIARAPEIPLEKCVLIGSAGGLCAILVASMTNPFLNSSIGMGGVIFVTLVVDLIQKNEFICSLKNDSNTLVPRIIVVTQGG